MYYYNNGRYPYRKSGRRLYRYTHSRHGDTCYQQLLRQWQHYSFPRRWHYGLRTCLSMELFINRIYGFVEHCFRRHQLDLYYAYTYIDHLLPMPGNLYRIGCFRHLCIRVRDD